MSLFRGNLRDCLPNASTDAGDKNLLHNLENGFASHDALRIATALSPILMVAPMQGCPAKQAQYCPTRLELDRP